MARPSTATGSRPNARAPARQPYPRSGAGLAETDPGIQVAIQHVHDDVHADEQDRDPEDRALHERVVALNDRGEEHAADAGNREHLLDDDRAAEQLTDSDAEERDHDDETVPEDVPADDDPRGQPLRGRGPDVVRAEDIEHRRPRHAHRRRGEAEPERYRGE